MGHKFRLANTYRYLYQRNKCKAIASEVPAVLADVCRLWADAGPCREFVVRWYYDHELGDCLQFMYGGCEGNSNQFETKEECLQRCPIESQNIFSHTLNHFCRLSGGLRQPVC